MNIKTRCDLSGQTAILDLSAIKKTIEIHFFQGLEKINKELTAYRYDFGKNKEDKVFSFNCTGFSHIDGMLDDMKTTAEILNTLYNLDNREIEIKQ